MSQQSHWALGQPSGSSVIATRGASLEEEAGVELSFPNPRLILSLERYFMLLLLLSRMHLNLNNFKLHLEHWESCSSTARKDEEFLLLLQNQHNLVWDREKLCYSVGKSPTKSHHFTTKMQAIPMRYFLVIFKHLESTLIIVATNIFFSLTDGASNSRILC